MGRFKPQLRRGQRKARPLSHNPFWRSRRPLSTYLRKHADPDGNALKRWSELTGYIRGTIVNVFIILGLLLLTVMLSTFVARDLKPKTLVEPIPVPKELSDRGFSDNVIQGALADSLERIAREARQTVPIEISERVEAATPEPALDIPGTSISLQSMVWYLRRSLDNTVFVSGQVVRNEKNFTIYLTVRGSHGIYMDEQDDLHTKPNEDIKKIVSAIAENIMHWNNGFIYASHLSVLARRKCYLDTSQCDSSFTPAMLAFNEIINHGPRDENYKWALLALSKIAEDRSRFDEEIADACKAIQQDPEFYWAYYNIGIALAELGYTDEAIDAFKQATHYNQELGIAFNALGRQYLVRAASISNKTHDDDVESAIHALQNAIKIIPQYQEAHINLANAMYFKKSVDDASREFNAAISLGDKGAARAYQGLSTIAKDRRQYDDADNYSKDVKSLDSNNFVCMRNLPKTLREAQGCSNVNMGLTQVAGAADFHNTQARKKGEESILGLECKQLNMSEFPKGDVTLPRRAG